MAPQIFFHLPEYHVNLHGLKWFQHNWPQQQDSSQYGMEEPSALLEGGLEGWLVTGMWYPVVSTLAMYAPCTPGIVLDVSGAPNTV